jgi:hypothetical protein
MLATIPVGAVQEMSVLSNAFSAEFGWTSSAAVNIVTRGGSNALHGEALLLDRPGSLQARRLNDQVLAPDIPDALTQLSGSLGGPIVRDRTHYFAAFDYTHQNRTAPITTPLVPAGTSVEGHYRQALVDARVDHRLSPSNSLMTRANVDRFYDTNPQDVVSGNTLPSAGRRFTRHTWSVQLNASAVIGSRLFNEARVEYLNGDPITEFEPLKPSTQFTRAGAAPFTVGESRYAHIFSRQVHVSDTLSWASGAHYVRLGGHATRATSGGDGTEFGSPFVLGQFTVLSTSTRPPDQLTTADIQSYTQGFNFGVSEYTARQWLVAAFVQDSYRVLNDLTLDFGLRYDRQTFSDAAANVAPRVGFGWHPRGDAKTAVRGGYGMYFTQLRSNLAANFELNGPRGIGSYSASAGQTGFPACLTCTPVVFDVNAAASTLPARNVTIRPGLRAFYTSEFARYGVDFSRLPDYPDALVNPRSQVVSLGIEREVASRLTVAADYVHQHVGNLDRTVDLNAPAPFDRSDARQVRSPAAADATRPIAPINGGFRQVNVIMNRGEADYDALQTSLRYTAAERFTASVSYTLSKAMNTTEPDGNGIGPNDAHISRLGDEELGPSLLDQRHRAVIAVSARLPYHITAGTVTQLASARPVNPVTGVDNNGDRANNDRPVINGAVAGKSSFRGSAQSDVSLFAEARVPAGHHHLLLRAEVFNVFNHANILGRNNVYGDTGTALPTFGTPNAGLANIDPPRMAQLQIRYQF